MLDLIAYTLVQEMLKHTRIDLLNESFAFSPLKRQGETILIYPLNMDFPATAL